MSERDGTGVCRAREFRKRGWPPLPLPAGKKEWPPKGTTGRDGTDLTAAKIDAADWSGNIALRMPPDVIGLDLDSYKGGDATLNKLEDDLGRLPPTWIIHNGRDDGSGIRLYRVPWGSAFVTGLPGLDVIQRTHRYAMAPGSMHPSGREYELEDPNGGEAEAFPYVDDLPDLPALWVEHLLRTSLDDGAAQHISAASAAEVTVFLDTHVRADAPAYGRAIEAEFTGRWHDGYSRHDTMQHCLLWAMENARAEVLEAKPTVERLGELWVAAVSPDARRMELSSDRRVTEFDAMVRYAIGKANTKTQDELNRLHDKVVGIRIKTGQSAAANGDQPTSSTVPVSRRTVTLSSVENTKARRVRWLWADRVPLGSLALLGGREGIGKSILAYTLAAQITTGQLEGELRGQPRPVVVVATEDSWEHTIIPRLIVAGADLTRIQRLTVATSTDQPSTLVLPHDIEGLHHATVDVGAALVLLDPIISRLDAVLDTHRDAEVRQGLEPLSENADRGRYSVLGLIHVNKGTSNDPLTMLMASRAFAAVARAVLFTTLDPEQPGMRLLGEPKNNLGRTDLPTLMFDIVEKVAGADPDDGLPIKTGKLRWAGVSQRTILDALHDAARSPDARQAGKEAEDWLRDYLDANPVADSKDVKAAASAEGHSKRTVERAREKIGAGVMPVGFPRRTVWSKPGLTPDEVEQTVASGAASSDEGGAE
jgi:hypothetical protein